MPESKQPYPRAPDRFRIIITGTTSAARTRENIQPWVGNLFAALVTGNPCPTASFRSWGLTVEVEPDMDQCDDGPPLGFPQGMD